MRTVRLILAPPLAPAGVSVIALDDAEVVSFRIPHPDAGLEPLLDGRAQLGEAVDLRQPVRGRDVPYRAPIGL